MTRLADITGLDRIGFPVWQTVRPAGRALSVHQGKGATPLRARIGALCEAIESHCAEQAVADGPLCTYAALPPTARAPDLGDYLLRRDEPGRASDPVPWCRARDLVSGGEQFLPHDLVSLDFTNYTHSPFDRSSSGLAVGANEEEALLTALLEALERDAVGEWERGGFIARMVTAVEPASIPFDWFAHWCGRLASCDATVAVHQAQAAIDLPVFICAISGRPEYGRQRRIAIGSAAHGDPEIALFKALAEALQSRLTFIAGARDDILPGDYGLEGEPAGPWLPSPPPGAGFAHWNGAASGPGSLEALSGALVEAGYRQIVAKQLGMDLPGVHVVKLFVPGLGSRRRRRRRPR